MKLESKSIDLAQKDGSINSADFTLNTRRYQAVRMSFHSYSGIKRHYARRSNCLI